MMTRRTFQYNKLGEGVLQFLKIIHQGPQDTIIFHIQHEKVSVDGENFSMLLLWSLTLKRSN